MRNLIIISALFLVYCKSKEAITIYEYDPKANQNPITPDNLSLFFEKDRKDILIFKVEDKKLNDEFTNIQRHIELKGNTNETINKLGIFYFAFIKNNDTIYADYELQYWKFKNKSSFYKSQALKEKIFPLK